MEPPIDPQATFRYDTYGDEALWTDVLRFNEGVVTISPETALAVGFKVDAEALPEGILATADLTDPAVVADILEIPEATVKTRFHRAKRLIQQRLLEHCRAAGISVHKFAGARCDTIARNVMDELHRRAERGHT